jgi:hypothetical protein
VGSRTGLGDVRKRKILILPGLEVLPLSCPARRERYLGSQYYIYIIKLYLGAVQTNVTTVHSRDQVVASRQTNKVIKLKVSGGGRWVRFTRTLDRGRLAS